MLEYCCCYIIICVRTTYLPSVASFWWEKQWGVTQTSVWWFFKWAYQCNSQQIRLPMLNCLKVKFVKLFYIFPLICSCFFAMPVAQYSNCQSRPADRLLIKEVNQNCFLLTKIWFYHNEKGLDNPPFWKSLN